MSSDLRKAALRWLDTNDPPGLGVRSNSSPKDFLRLTGLTHEALMNSWQSWADNGKKPGTPFLTCCNSFAIQYCAALKLPNTLVRFSVEAIRKNLADKAYAVIDPSAQVCPNPGDIMIWKGVRVGITLHSEIVGEDEQIRVTDFITVEGGQNHVVWKTEKDAAMGKWKNTNTIDTNNSYDSVKRKKCPDAPNGGGGIGFFCNAGAMYDDVFGNGLPNPWAPAVRNLDPLAIQRLVKDHGAERR
jgi:hypothetical protein